MHRRSLAELASTSSASFSRTTKRHASNVTRNPKHTREGSLPRKTYDAIKRLNKELVYNNVKKQNAAGWGHPPHYEGETRRLREAVKRSVNPNRLPTPELQELLAAQDFSIDPQDAAVHDRTTRVPPGSLVEIRRNEIVFYGVVVQNTVENGMLKSHSLLSGGDLWPHSQSDIMIYIPGFVEPDLIARCGSDQSISLSESEINARVHVLKRMRNFEIAVEEKVADIYHRLRGAYDALRHPEPSKATTTSVDAVVRLISPRRPVDVQTRWAIHKYLFDKAHLFVAESSDFLTRSTFTVRAKNEVDDIEAVNKMVARRDPIVARFVEKARALIRASRKREQDTWRQPPSYTADNTTTFTPEELTIIRFFFAASHGTRTTQKDPFEISLSYILKRVGLYDRQNLGTASAHPFLVELGVIPPWVDPIERFHVSAEERASRGMALLKGSITHDHPASSSASAATTSTHSAYGRALGPEDFYSRDLVEHLRHDFGNLPAYVIDDIDAEELDDAISIESVPNEPDHAWLHVHIADPTSVLPPTHEIARQAFSRLETHYYLDRSYPLLPNVPQLRELSLGKDGPQVVMTFSGKVDLEGNIIEYKIRPGIIRSARKLHYDSVNEAIGEPTAPRSFPLGGEDRRPPPDAASLDKAAVDNIRFAKKFTDALVKNRILTGALQLEWSYAELALNPKPLPETPPLLNRPYLWSGFPQMDFWVGTTKTAEAGARQIVAESARLAGRIASMWFKERGVPAIRRIAAPFTEAVPGALQRALKMRDEQGFLDSFTLIGHGLLPSGATYDIVPGPHAILGIPESEGYMRTTSPLRRFLDMMTHWQIKQALLSPEQPRLFEDEWLRGVAKHVAWWETYENHAQRKHHAYWAYKCLQRWLVEHKGTPEAERFQKSLTAFVASTPVNNFYVQYWQAACFIWSLGMKADLIHLEPGGSIEVGQEVPVKIADLELGLNSTLALVKR
ncbi:hypothetical protein FOMPIDRAFT_1131121 [Fomitopsis schrenkii]|uniref:RNB domain-containing protein n=1 Tax=Fomitopsis schrenkii TaxID=2126942 RepID=S8F2V0_FOMSC|nr:hypothetical protein FOMPIDRAFT_1131121 [Fomitopsis schrenkii]